MGKTTGKVMILPCSGIGKAFASVGREATYLAIEDLRPGLTDTVCLSALVMGDEEARAKVRGNPCITVDGCPTACARKNVELAGGDVAGVLRVPDTYKQHRELKPAAITELDEAGKQLAAFLAERIAAEVDEVRRSRGW